MLDLEVINVLDLRVEDEGLAVGELEGVMIELGGATTPPNAKIALFSAV